MKVELTVFLGSEDDVEKHTRRITADSVADAISTALDLQLIGEGAQKVTFRKVAERQTAQK